jgi:hypothetical protein
MNIQEMANRKIRESTTKIETTTVMFILLNVISCFTLLQHEITFDKVINLKLLVAM